MNTALAATSALPNAAGRMCAGWAGTAQKQPATGSRTTFALRCKAFGRGAAEDRQGEVGTILGRLRVECGRTERVVEWYNRLMAVFCQRCKSENSDPGGDLTPYTCGVCGGGPLVRMEKGRQPSRAAEAGVVGAMVGGAFAGAAGMLVGGLLGILLERGARRWFATSSVASCP